MVISCTPSYVFSSIFLVLCEHLPGGRWYEWLLGHQAWRSVPEVFRNALQFVVDDVLRSEGGTRNTGFHG